MGKIGKALKKLVDVCTADGTTPTGNSTGDLLECIADNFDVNGEDGQDGADGASVTAINLVTTEGAVTGGTATLSDGTTINITVTTSGD